MAPYKAHTFLPITQAKAKELGKWLGQYQIQIAGLSVWQITEDGKRIRDDAMADTIKSTAGSAGGATMASGPAAPLLGPLVALLSPAAILAMAAAIPALIAAQHKLRKEAGPQMRGHTIVATEIEFVLTGVSAKRRKWSEYLLSIYAAHHKWTLTGMQHGEQIAVGAAYAARTGGYPRPWSDTGRTSRTIKRSRPHGRGGLRGLLSHFDL